MTEKYLMAVACEVRRVLAEKPNEIQPEEFQLKFEFKRPPSAKQKAEKAKQERILNREKWKAVTGYSVRKPPKSKT